MEETIETIEARIKAVRAERDEALRLSQHPTTPGMMRRQHSETAAACTRYIQRLEREKSSRR